MTEGTYNFSRVDMFDVISKAKLSGPTRAAVQYILVDLTDDPALAASTWGVDYLEDFAEFLSLLKSSEVPVDKYILSHIFFAGEGSLRLSKPGRSLPDVAKAAIHLSTLEHNDDVDEAAAVRAVIASNPTMPWRALKAARLVK